MHALHAANSMQASGVIKITRTGMRVHIKEHAAETIAR